MKAHIAVAAFLATAPAVAIAGVDVQFAPGKKAGGFDRVLIAPPTVEFDREWLRRETSMIQVRDPLREEDLEELRRDMGTRFRDALTDAFRAQGFQIATTAGPGVLQINPAVRDLYVSAPDVKRSTPVRHFVREAGRAKLQVEGRDAQGERVLTASDDTTAGWTPEFQRASKVSNRFWFDAAFQRWADDLAVALAKR